MAAPRSHDEIPAGAAGPSPAAWAAALERLRRDDAAALPLLDAAAAEAYAGTAAALDFRRARAVIGEGARAVRQDFDIVMPLPAASPLQALADAIERQLNAGLSRLKPPPLATPLRLNDRVVQRYPAGSRGISAHRDHVRYRGVVVIVQLSGDGCFTIAQDREGTGARPIASRPGWAILMRAPGFDGGTERPFHALAAITSERYSFGLRHDAQG